MNIEVIITTMHATGFDKFYEMNIQTDAIIANQSDHCDYKETVINGCRVKLITTNTKGLSINRNIGLSNSTADFIMFADDDMIFVDDYENAIEKEFAIKKKIDAIKFYCNSTNPNRPSPVKPTKLQKARIRKIMTGGVHALVVKRDFIMKHNLLFAINYGAGTKIYMGEDSIFCMDLYKISKLFYMSPIFLADIKQEDSSWFEGYTQRYFENLGYLHTKLYNRLAYVSLIRRVYKTRKKHQVKFSFKEMLIFTYSGVKKYYE